MISDLWASLPEAKRHDGLVSKLKQLHNSGKDEVDVVIRGAVRKRTATPP